MIPQSGPAALREAAANARQFEEGARPPRETVEERVRQLLEGNDEFDREVFLETLSQLSPAIYAPYRERAAQRLGGDGRPIALTFLDREMESRQAARRQKEDETATDTTTRVLACWKVEPWHESVPTSDLLDEVRATVLRHVILPAKAARAATLWLLHTWTFEASDWLPILAITSPVMRCGKTRLLELLFELCPRPLVGANITAAAFFRMIAKHAPTALIDEADAFMGDVESLRGIMNAGRSRRSAFIWRTEGDAHEPKAFSVFAPLAIARIGALSPTLADRSIPVAMSRKAKGKRVEPLRKGIEFLADLRRKLARWSADSTGILRGADPDLPEELDDRAADNWRAMIAIADLAGDDWPTSAREAAVAISGSGAAETGSVGEMLLADLRNLFHESNADKLASSVIVERIGKLEDRPWIEFGKANKPISTRQLARLLEPFGIRPKTIRLSEGGTPKGYDLAELAEAFDCYLGPNTAPSPMKLGCEAPQRHNPHRASVRTDFSPATTGSVRRIENERNPLGDKDSGAVAHRDAVSGFQEIDLPNASSSMKELLARIAREGAGEWVLDHCRDLVELADAAGSESARLSALEQILAAWKGRR